MFETDLNHKDSLSQIMKSIHNFFENPQNTQIVFFSNNHNALTENLVKNFCLAFRFEFRKEVQIIASN